MHTKTPTKKAYQTPTKKRVKKRVQKRVTKNAYKNTYKKRLQKRVKKRIHKNAYIKTHTKKHVQKTRTRAHATAPRMGDGRSAPTPCFLGSTRVIRWTRGRWRSLSYFTKEPVLFHAKKIT